jgi:hypothetical protein
VTLWSVIYITDHEARKNYLSEGRTPSFRLQATGQPENEADTQSSAPPLRMGMRDGATANGSCLGCWAGFIRLLKQFYFCNVRIYATTDLI